MTEANGPLLHVWLAVDQGDGARFMTDIEQMLVAVATRQDVQISHVAPPSMWPASPQHVFLRVLRGSAAVFLAELGMHRGQLIPHDSTIGRVFTSTVGVEVLEAGATPSTGKPGGAVAIKTYNYVQRRATRHSTGRTVSLDAMLAGAE